jgi:CRP/FNR family cyclic AMP-dependent transcriptional regulator
MSLAMRSKIADLLDELELFREGDAGNYMFILSSGRIGVFKGGEHGEQLLSHEIRGRIVGEMALLDHEKRSATCIAESDCELLTFTQENLKKLAADHPAIGYHFLFSLARLLSKRLRRASGMMADFLHD